MITFSGPVSNQPTLTHLFENKVGQQEAFSQCTSLGGRLPLPLNEAELYITYNFSSNKACKRLYWTPIVRLANSENSWISKVGGSNSEMEITFLPWDRGQPTNNSGEDCIGISEKLLLQNDKCILNFFYFCQFGEQVKLKYLTLLNCNIYQQVYGGKSTNHF